MDLSLVVPLFNEDESLPELCAWIKRVVDANGFTYEIILIDDGSTDNSWKVVEELRAANPHIKGIRFQRNYGKSAALNEGFKAAQGDVVITMDADLQDSPDEIPELRRMIIEDGFDMISGWKKKRFDNTLTKNIPSKFFNWATRRASKIQLHDFNCGLKSYRGKVVKSIEVYGEMHRYIPVLAKWAGFRKIGEKVVEHRARKYGTTKFGWERFVNGFLDLASIMFVSKYGKRPMHFFGLLGSLFFMVGFLIVLYLLGIKIYDMNNSLTNRPSFYVALTSMVIGTQLFLAGFLGELISRNAPGRNHYLIEQKLGIE
ncbi:glycosyltransferase family 2 protein [Pseudoflavitalea sp. G-6-1-2]|uniref:glycosyltransferase family 2 protein n=1 Tax=Pseudoflavitalea sp. G-6-1-2 TaxID=2728841 RepID=UPI00146D6339|nr:glycosyltransferase family 2 protein [Pseudoflavitalea sp. G-6-1-2]NML21289.1 glycosyltransferase family 2 protein [Pseudoflavitalea sp. G-6-1-2]